MPAACYDEYADRGESENRNKELKCGLQADRLSDHRYFANLFRLYLHATAHNLLVRSRHVVVDPPAEPAAINFVGEAAEPDVPVEALSGSRRRQWHNLRREHDPLAEGQPCTWRTRLIKVAAYVFESARRVMVQVSPDVGPGKRQNEMAKLIVCFLAHQRAHDGQNPGPEDFQESLIPFGRITGQLPHLFSAADDHAAKFPRRDPHRC
jgi:hypothetical protein